VLGRRETLPHAGEGEKGISFGKMEKATHNLDKFSKTLVLKEGSLFNFVVALFKFKGTVLPEVLAQVILNIIITLRK
jgi:hypothetical protein